MLKKEHIYILLLIILCGFLFFYKLGNLPLLDPDEPRYAEVAREIGESKNFFIPYFNYQPRLNKPPLYYWLVYLSYFLWGQNEWAARLPSAVFALGTVLVVFLLGTEIYGQSSLGFLAGLILATSWEFLIIARLVIIDAMLSFFVLTALFCFIKFRNYKKKFYLYGLWICLGFAFLSKGPVGLIPLLIFLFYSVIEKNFVLFKKIFNLPAILIFLILGLSWYGLIVFKLGFKEAMILLRHQTLERFMAGYIHNEPALYYFTIIFAGFMPWTVFLPWIKIDFEKEKFIVSWILVIFLFFSLSRSKLATYILPLFPGLSIFSAKFWQEAFRGRMEKVSLKIFFSASVFLLIISFSLLWIKGFILKNYDLDLSSRLLISFILTAVIIFLLLYFTLRRKPHLAFSSFIGYTFCLIILFYGMFAVDLGSLRSTKALIQPLKKMFQAQDKLIAYKIKKPSLVFYSQHKIIFLDEMPLLLEYINEEKTKLFLIIKDTDLTELKQKFNLPVEAKQHGYLILRRDKQE